MPDVNGTPPMSKPPGRLFTLKLRAFRAFRDEVSIDIRPLTLLYGFNQAGKSTLLRVLALLADSLQAGAGPLDLQSPALRGATFKELGWMGQAPNLSPWLTLSAPGQPNDPTFKIQFSDANGLIVNRLQVTPGIEGDKFKVDLDGTITREGNTISAGYAGTYRGQDWDGVLQFDRFFPSGLPEQAEALVQCVREALAPLQRLQWLYANRLTGGNGARPTRCCSPDGSDLPARLRAASNPSILDSASRWLTQQEGLGNEIALRVNAAGQPELIHGAQGREELPLHLAGEGIRSLLPILLCALWAETHVSTAPSMLAVEEPEAHLHPTLQVALFDRLVETVSQGIPVLLETHSVYLLRAMQVAVLEGRLMPSQVGLHWVEPGSDGASTVTTIGIAADATLSGWRPDVFEKEQELAHRVLDLRWQQARP
ncbi:MAG: AAA family ATPase [Candidatus Competibacter sp.]